MKFYGLFFIQNIFNLIGKTLEELMSWGVDDKKLRETINKLLITQNKDHKEEGYLFNLKRILFYS